MRADVYLAAGAAALLGTIPMLVIAVSALAERDYVGGALLVFASAAIGHMGLELVALGEQLKSRLADGNPTGSGDDDPA